MFDVPETIIEIVVVLHSDSFVFRLDVLCAHGGFANSQRVSFTLGKYGHNGPLLTGSHPGIGMGQTCGGALVSHTGTEGRTWAHDVGAGQDELDGALVHHLGGQQEGELVQQPQGGNPGLIVVPRRQRLYKEKYFQSTNLQKSRSPPELIRSSTWS